MSPSTPRAHARQKFETREDARAPWDSTRLCCPVMLWDCRPYIQHGRVSLLDCLQRNFPHQLLERDQSTNTLVDRSTWTCNNNYYVIIYKVQYLTIKAAQDDLQTQTYKNDRNKWWSNHSKVSKVHTLEPHHSLTDAYKNISNSNRTM